MQNQEAARLNCSTIQYLIKCSKYHSSIIGLPTELWVKRMMEVAGLEGLIDPEDFVFYLYCFHLGKSICERNDYCLSFLQEIERS